MSAIQQLLTEHLDIWTAADAGPKSGRGRSSANAGKVYGVSKLRELILELAVRGKLVPQDAGDEPASELLKRIQAEKSKLITAGAAKKDNPLPLITDNEIPFSLPNGWEWVRLGDISLKITDGEHISPKKTSSGMPLLTAKDVTDGGVIVSSPQYVSQEDGELFRRRCNPEKGDALICSRGTIGRCTSVEIDDIFCLMGSVILVKASRNNFYKYIVRYLQTEMAQKWMRGASFATAVSALYLKDVTKCLVPLPSFAEQRRIVAKVDELMALCDQLESKHNNATEAHEKLVSHLLDTLIQSQSAEDLSANWQRIATHFDVLFTTEASIDALKQTLLQLAVMGKLVPQDPNDEPASELLKRIQAEKARLIAEGKIKKDKPLTPKTDEEEPFNLPKGWEWVSLDEISQVGTGATPLRTKSEYFNPAIISWVTSGETSGSYVFETEQYVSPLALEETNLTVYPKGTLIVAMYGQGKTRGQITELMIDACTNQACAAIRLFSADDLHRKYVKLFFEKIYDEIRELAAGGAQPNLNLSKVKETLLPLPPLAEQHRIVAKIDELTALCDQLKSRLTEASQLQQKLADVLVETAVAENARQSSNRNTGK